jgi:putative N6-adenine-specific DNA methylase
MKEKEALFVTCGPELEPLLIQELTELGISNLTLGYRGVYIDSWTWPIVYRINYGSRIASRVLVPLTRFKCYDQKDLYRGVSDINWLPYLNGLHTIAIDANVDKHHEIRNSLYAAQITKDAICDQLRTATGKRPSVDLQKPDLQLNLYIQKEWAILSFDTSGAPLHKRGYRLEAVEAPIQESLAAAILRLAGYKADDILFDPCCGSGTFLIEAALIASRTPPGYLRKRWGFKNHPEYSELDWLNVRNELDSLRKPMDPRHIFGVDINRNAIRIAKGNLRAAGFHQFIEVAQADFKEYTPPVTPNFFIANPPHGVRLDEEDVLKPLYRSLGEFMKQKCSKPSRGFVFTSNMELAKEVGLAPQRRHVLSSGGLDARLLEYPIF